MKKLLAVLIAGTFAAGAFAQAAAPAAPVQAPAKAAAPAAKHMKAKSTHSHKQVKHSSKKMHKAM
ncbi:MAG: hypothetical protein RR473_12370 [Comamonas sp.]|uniref:hypothetical protein n=1 Tax=unclassified Comamonas TaxID=2638500 RepID=UPI000EB36CC4|nr:hypothetical protein [Comamonas sp. lk]